MCYDGFHRHWAFKVFYGCRSSPRSAPTLAGFFLSGPPTVQGKGARSLQRHTQNNPSYRVRNSLEDSPTFQAAQGFCTRGMPPSRKVAEGIGRQPREWSIEVRSVVPHLAGWACRPVNVIAHTAKNRRGPAEGTRGRPLPLRQGKKSLPGSRGRSLARRPGYAGRLLELP